MLYNGRVVEGVPHRTSTACISSHRPGLLLDGYLPMNDDGERVAGVLEMVEANGRGGRRERRDRRDRRRDRGERNGPQGVLRDPKRNYSPRPADPVVSSEMIRRFSLRGGETLSGLVAGHGAQRRLAQIEQINDAAPDAYLETRPFAELTVIDPDRALRFETPGGPTSMRAVDILTPIGRGQRGLIVAAPRTGKTILLQQMAHGLAVNHPDIYTIVLLIDERPEEVTDMRRNVHGEVVASSNDENIASHVRVARLILSKAQRMVETGKDVFILLDSLTRLGRAFNAFVGTTGRTMSGGLDIRALAEPKQIFGAARNIEDGGSLTIVATALIETGSRMDEVIFNEFKGTGNMELMLTRDLANLRIWPAIDIPASGTRKEDRLLGPDVIEKVYRIRRRLAGMPPDRAMTTLIAELEKFPDNATYFKNQAD